MKVVSLTQTAVPGGVVLSWGVESGSYLDGFSFIVKAKSTGNVLLSKRVMDPSIRSIQITNLPLEEVTCNVACEQRTGGVTVPAMPGVGLPEPIDPPEVVPT